MVESTTAKGHQGKGSDRSNRDGGRNSTTEHKKQTMEFTPHITGKHQSVTYDTVKDHILQEIQKDLKNGSDMAVNLRKDTDARIPIVKPKRQIVKSVKLEEGESADPADLLIEIRIEQEGYDMEYTIDLKEWKV